MAQLRSSPFRNPTVAAGNYQFVDKAPHFPSLALSTSRYSSNLNLNLSLHRPKASSNPAGIPQYPPKTEYSGGGADGGSGSGRRGGGSGGGDDGKSQGGADSSDRSNQSDFGILGLFINGWRSRVAADPQFPFKVLMEELVGVTACVLGDMASRPNFGLNELDFVFSTLVVGSILNFVLMYLLAPTAAASGSAALPAIFASCPKSHMFEVGAYSILDRLGTFVYKGALFSAVGFAAGLVGTALSNGMIKMRKKMDPEFETPNKAPPTLLNALTWAIHMGVSSNLRYQTLNGLEFVLAKGLPPLGFKASVIVLRCLNNVLGGMSFVVLARLTGSQKVDEATVGPVIEPAGTEEEKEKLVEREGDLQESQSYK
ncbi:protein RETICULATA-RELATED 3, chloroplastic-like [Aristolochia californica]|uniref:protein RETICULATA-RELATED 3, chloroplastic-like n=1 Tax=Aristolochia californica TaxID=171875 RepID=UPI0035DB578A